jgi:hypothetical protein
MFVILIMYREGVVGTANGWTTEGLKFEYRQSHKFSLLHMVQTGFGAHPIPWVPGTLSQGVKWTGGMADHSPHTSAEVKKTWVYTSTPPYVFMALCLIS